MILKGSQRGGSQQLGLHLLKTTENEHVEVHEIRGFMADNVLGAMKEAKAVSMGTRCRKHLFSISLNPPQDADVSPEAFESALIKIEERTGLTGQPRIVIFHEKEGRRHCHAVWSRINADEMKAVPLPHFKYRLQEVSKELFIEHGWELPNGMRDKKNRDPRNFTLDEWQLAKRIGKNPKDLKAAMQDAWNISDSRKTFERALEDRGLFLAKGDKRGHVAVTYEGETLSVARYTGKKAKEVRERFGKSDELRSVTETKERISDFMTPQVNKYLREAKFKNFKEMQPLTTQRETMTEAHRVERNRFNQQQQERWNAETNARAQRMSKGFKGLWEKLTGKQAMIRKQNEMETFFRQERDKKQAHDLRTAQMNERRTLQAQIHQKRIEAVRQQTELHKDLASYRRMQERQATRLTERFNNRAHLRKSIASQRNNTHHFER